MIPERDHDVYLARTCVNKPTCSSSPQLERGIFSLQFELRGTDHALELLASAVGSN